MEGRICLVYVAAPIDEFLLIAVSRDVVFQKQLAGDGVGIGIEAQIAANDCRWTTSPNARPPANQDYLGIFIEDEVVCHLADDDVTNVDMHR